jgi:hypothetical protein
VNTPIALRSYYTARHGDQFAARVLTNYVNENKEHNSPGTPFRRSEKVLSRTAVALMSYVNGSVAWEMSCSELFRSHDLGTCAREFYKLNQPLSTKLWLLRD